MECILRSFGSSVWSRPNLTRRERWGVSNFWGRSCHRMPTAQSPSLLLSGGRAASSLGPSFHICRRKRWAPNTVVPAKLSLGRHEGRVHWGGAGFNQVRQGDRPPPPLQIGSPQNLNYKDQVQPKCSTPRVTRAVCLSSTQITTPVTWSDPGFPASLKFELFRVGKTSFSEFHQINFMQDRWGYEQAKSSLERYRSKLINDEFPLRKVNRIFPYTGSATKATFGISSLLPQPPRVLVTCTRYKVLAFTQPCSQWGQTGRVIRARWMGQRRGSSCRAHGRTRNKSRVTAEARSEHRCVWPQTSDSPLSHTSPPGPLVRPPECGECTTAAPPSPGLPGAPAPVWAAAPRAPGSSTPVCDRGPTSPNCYED